MVTTKVPGLAYRCVAVDEVDQPVSGVPSPKFHLYSRPLPPLAFRPP